MAHETEIPTRERLIEAAGELFGDKGFDSTSVREICARAGANVASVNYHFRDKANLAEEVLVHIFEHGSADHPVEETVKPDWPPERQLHAFVHRFLLTRMDPARPDWHQKVIFREMLEPGPNMKAVVDRVIRRNAEVLFGILRRILGKKAPRSFIGRCQHSVIGQCVHFVHHRKVVDRVHPGLIDGSDTGIEALARHITDFSLAAIENLRVPSEEDQGREEAK